MIAKRTQRAFTLMELLVAVGIIALMLIVVLPSIGKLFGNHAEVQARNLIDARLKTARAIAIRDRRPTGVHFQRHSQTREFWSAIVQAVSEDASLSKHRNHWFEADSGSIDSSVPQTNQNLVTLNRSVMRLVDGTQPAKLPGGVGVGRVTRDINNDYSGLPSDPKEFTTFTVLFDEEGRLIDPDDGTYDFVQAHSDGKFHSPIFIADVTDPDVDFKIQIWELPAWDDIYAKALCVFDSQTFDNLEGSTGVTQADYLNENAQFLPVAPYVGGLIRTAAE